MSFKDKDFSARFGAMGDESENTFMRVWPTNYVRFGLNRPPLRMSSLPERLRHTPDFLTSSHLVECKGVGKDDLVKIKLKELNCLWYWHQLHPVRIFVWSTTRFAWAVADLPEIQRMLDNGDATLDKFHDGGAYFAIPGSLFCWTELDRIDNSEMVDATRD